MDILVIEPDKILGGSIKNALEAFNYKVTWKRNAQTALDSLDESVPSLIILELQLGLHNGVEFLYEVASYPEWQHIPVVVHTINAKAGEKEFAESLAQLSVKSVMYKPKTSTAKLVNIVKQLALAQ